MNSRSPGRNFSAPSKNWKTPTLCHEAGADDYVTKPNGYEKLIEEVKALCKRLLQVSP
jgi:DNA-binding response OmpR family regulator